MAGRVGVVVPAYNAERWVLATLESLQAQTLGDWACAVVDDGSVDGTAGNVAQVAAHDPRVPLVRQSNAGLPSARNAGLRSLPSDCHTVSFLDSDDLLMPHALAVLAALLDRRPDAFGAYGLAEYVDEVGAPLRIGAHSRRQRSRRRLEGRHMVDFAPSDDATFDTIAVVGPIWPPAVAVHRRSVVDVLRGFAPAFLMQEDWDFYLRISRLGPYAAVDEQVVWYRRHGANLTGRHDESVCYQERGRRAVWLSLDNSPAQRRVVARPWRHLEARQVVQMARHAGGSLASRQWATTATSAAGAAQSAAQLLRAGPPPPDLARARRTRPAELGARL